MAKSTDSEIAFHLSTLLVDLRALSALSIVSSREGWVSTTLPMLAHTAGICTALGTCLDGEPARIALALTQNIGALKPPPDSNIETWKSINEACKLLLDELSALGIKPWTFPAPVKA
ncbi:MAG TPA: hypothetical protein VGM06_25450 [Polyangiaceae bacterium]